MFSVLVDPGDKDTERFAAWLNEVGLAGPAYLLLQGLRPISFLGGQGMLFLQPFLPVEKWRSAAGRLAGILDDRSRLDDLLALLEARLRYQQGVRDKEE